jgi:tetratricopeptide (TPR) repeat protein
MTDRQDTPNSVGPADILQESWLHQSYLMGHPLEQKEHYAEALAIYNKVLERDEKNILAYLLKGGAQANITDREQIKQEDLSFTLRTLLSSTMRLSIKALNWMSALH